ncbi:RHS repeat-associated core domain-containing protein [Aquincola sp. J276]|uniref:RHS repeat-associated core domain-containing protein n=1 Tax=Aquincola sp. J276 TaxID=2898432 RepID=UPI002151F21F|nr:RHS repeat-associated core domain-containing protein [Aquincola sp. J276]MCR5867058.1 DUF6531 domain-containing protein [Aquincola sp. J276]
MMPAAKHGDVQMGVDIHLCMVPTPAPTPTPLPTPHMSVVFDPFDYVPVIGATITVCGMKRATAGTAGKVVHIPPGFPFAPKLPDTEDELFMGSSTVVADGDPMSHISHPVLSCQAAGMMSPFRLKKKGGPRAMVLPTVFNLATPTTVFVGGPPTISLMGMAMKGVFAGLGKLAKSGVFKRLRQKLFKNLKPGFLKCTVLRAEPVNILNGAVSLEQQDFQLPGRIDVDWLRCYSSADRHVGVCGTGWQTLLDIRLEVDAADGSVMLHGPGIGPLAFERLPAAPGAAGMQLELTDGARLTDEGDEWQVRTKDGRIHCFPKHLARGTAEGGGLVPIGRITDRCGNALTVEYRNGRPHALTESAGRRLALTLQDERLVAVTLVDAATRTDHGYVRYEYDDAGDLVAVIDALGAPYRFAYGRGDTAHHLLRHTDRLGLSFHYAYEAAPDGSQRVVHSWGDGGLYDYRFQYLDALNERRITDSLGHVSLVKLDDRGLPINEIDPLGGMTVYEYDDAGRTTAVVDPAGRRTEWSHDERGNLLRQVLADGSTLRLAFDADDRLVAMTDGNGGRWTSGFDARGLLVEQVSPLGHVQRFGYDAQGQLVRQVDARGGITTLGYDAWGQLSTIVDALGHATRFEQDVRGRLLSRTDPLGRRTECRYDPKGRLTQVLLPSGSAAACEYDAEDNIVAYTDANGQVTRLAYFGQGMLARRSQPDGHEVLYAYDTEERLVGVRDALHRWYRLVRDAAGRVVQEIDFVGRSTRFEHDAGGHLVATVDALGRRIDYRCDGLGRVVRRRQMPHPEGDGAAWVEQFAYDGDGHLLRADNPQARVTLVFDADGRNTLERQLHAGGLCFEIESAFDASGNRVRRALRAGPAPQSVTEWAFDALDRPLAMRLDGGEPIRFEHDAAGQLLHQRLSPGLLHGFAYDTDGRLVEQRLRSEAGLLAAAAYRYDRAGNLLQRGDGLGRTDRYQLDPMDRVVAHTDVEGLLHRIALAANGDRLQILEADAAGSTEGICAGHRYRHDAAWQLVAYTSAALGEVRLAWSADQRLAASCAIAAGGRIVTRYGYDALGRRLWKQTGEQRTWYGWDGDALVLQARPHEAGERRQEFVMRPGSFEPLLQLAAARWDEPARLLGFYLLDPNGAPWALVDPLGATLWADAGGGRCTGDPGVQPLRLQNQIADDETGLHYNRHRYFHPGLQAFASADPLGLDAGDNPYAYAPNLQSWTDPLGLKKCNINKQWLKKMGDAPAGMLNPHRHHIVMEGAFSHWRKENRKLVTEARSILRKHGIDLQKGPNVVWAQNAGHSVEYARAVRDRLKAADKGKNAAAKVRSALEDIGGILANGPLV